MISILLLAAALDINPAGAASFDCAKASRPTEWLTCASARLSVIDRKMGLVFSDLHKQSPVAQKTIVQGAQLAWLRQRETICGMASTNMDDRADKAQKTACLIRETSLRLQALNDQYRTQTGRRHWGDVDRRNSDKPARDKPAKDKSVEDKMDDALKN